MRIAQLASLALHCSMSTELVSAAGGEPIKLREPLEELEPIIVTIHPRPPPPEPTACRGFSDPDPAPPPWARKSRGTAQRKARQRRRRAG